MRCLYLITILLAGSCLGSRQAAAQTPLLPVKNNELVLDRPITFKAGSADLTEDGIEVLNDVKEYLKAKDYVSLMRVEGHVERTQVDQPLSEKRALAVCQWLTNQGIDCKRLLPVGFGRNKPLSKDGGGNTRITFAIASIKGRPIGGLPVDGGGKVAGNACK